MAPTVRAGTMVTIYKLMTIMVESGHTDDDGKYDIDGPGILTVMTTTMTAINMMATMTVSSSKQLV